MSAIDCVVPELTGSIPVFILTVFCVPFFVGSYKECIKVFAFVKKTKSKPKPIWLVVKIVLVFGSW